MLASETVDLSVYKYGEIPFGPGKHPAHPIWEVAKKICESVLGGSFQESVTACIGIAW
jgi:hypothetical protein